MTDLITTQKQTDSSPYFTSSRAH